MSQNRADLGFGTLLANAPVVDVALSVSPRFLDASFLYLHSFRMTIP